MSYSIENLKKLRSLTEVAIKECMKALDVSNDDLPKALEWLKKRSLSSSKSSKFEAGEKLNKFGLVKIANVGNRIIAFSLKCESDFVAMNNIFISLADKIALLLVEKFTTFINFSQEEINEKLKNLVSNASYSLGEKIYVEKISFFLKGEDEIFHQYVHHNAKVGAFVVVNRDNQQIARELAIQAVANSPLFLAVEDIPNQIVSAKIGEIRQLVNDENPNAKAVIAEKIINGKFNKWISEVCFLEQNDFRDPSRKIKQILLDTNINMKRLFLISIDN